MSSKVEKKVDDLQQEVKQVEEQQQEQEQEDEPVDIELQKQIQKVTIDESVFDQQTKQKEKGQKKVSKKKGQDFLDYANKNNIQINLQYGEEDKNFGSHQKKRVNEPISQEQPINPKGKYKGNNNNNKYKNSYKGNQQARKGQVKFGGNKFDACNQMPFQYGNPNQFQQNPEHKEITLTTDEQILGYLDRLFSLNSLNKDLYLRYRINEKGMINISELANYYGLKNNEVTPQRIIDVINKNDSVSSVGVVEETGIISVAIKHWNTILPQLNSIEVITAKKRQMKQQQAQASFQQNQYMPYTYIHMQNNYFLPSQGYYEMPGYGNNFPVQDMNKINNP